MPLLSFPPLLKSIHTLATYSRLCDLLLGNVTDSVSNCCMLQDSKY